MNEEIKKRMLRQENNLSKYGKKSTEGKRLHEEKDDDIRPIYFRDIDRVIHSLSYNRYLNKTQVYSFSHNDHVTMRITHVLMVSKIARTIGRSLLLNEDLIEAASLGHDLGHTPLGHTGEKILDKISLKYLKKHFYHNIQSVRTFMFIENKGYGLNLSIEVLDSIMCHNGEKLEEKYEYIKKTKEEFLREYNLSYLDKNISLNSKPMTLEGCVVRVSDVIAYVGRDIEDAITLNKLKRSDIPKEITDILGDNNRDIINNLILDIIKESFDKPYIKFSKRVYKALEKLIEFNYSHIYNYALSKEEIKRYEEKMEKLYKKALKDLERKDKTSKIYTDHLNILGKYYEENNSNEQIVIDYIAGMTDNYFLDLIDQL